MYIVLQC